jgi:hypothetical protein
LPLSDWGYGVHKWLSAFVTVAIEKESSAATLSTTDDAGKVSPDRAGMGKYAVRVLSMRNFIFSAAT